MGRLVWPIPLVWGLLLSVLWLVLSGCAASAPPQSVAHSFDQHAHTQRDEHVRVRVRVLSAEECVAVFGVPLYEVGVQPVWLSIENDDRVPYMLLDVTIDAQKFSPLEAAYRSHRWLSPARNRELDRRFLDQEMTRLIPPGAAVSGFVYTNLDLGAKEVQVLLIGPGREKRLTFLLVAPGLPTRFDEVDFTALSRADRRPAYDLGSLRPVLEGLPCCTTNADGSHPGDPVNLVLIGDIDELLTAFIDRQWDMTEKLQVRSAWHEVKAFLFGTAYRYAPFSPLYLYGRRQDLALQKARQTITARNHLRLWLAPMTSDGKPVWLGQISRDIGVRFTLRTWDLVTHLIDPHVDGARDYLVQDLLFSKRIVRLGYVRGGPPAPLTSPRQNLTGDPYITDGLRAVLEFSAEPVQLSALQKLDWAWPASFTLGDSAPAP
jgi:LssY C-terminus